MVAGIFAREYRWRASFLPRVLLLMEAQSSVSRGGHFLPPTWLGASFPNKALKPEAGVM